MIEIDLNRRLDEIDGVPVAQWLSEDPNLVGFAFAQKIRYGSPTGRWAVVAYLRKKLKPAQLSGRRHVPPLVRVQGREIPTDIVELSAKERNGIVNASTDTTRYRPAGPGSQIGTSAVAHGTFGALVVDNTDDSLQILTANAAILQSKTWTSGMSVFQPYPVLGAPPIGDRIGSLTRAADLSIGPRLYPKEETLTVNAFDGALIKPVDDDDVQSASVTNHLTLAERLQPMVGMIIGCEEVPAAGATCYIASSASSIFDGLDIRPRGSAQITAPTVGQRVHFNGIAGGLQFGTVTAINMTVWVRYAFGWTPQEGLVENTFLIQSDSDSDANIGAMVRSWAGNSVRSRCASCAITSGLETTYDLDMAGDVEVADWLRDNYVMRTYTGAILVQLFYKNEAEFQSRLLSADPTETERKFAEMLYAKYVDIVRNERDGTFSTYVPITSQVLDDIAAVTYGLSRFMTEQEYDACVQLIELLEESQGLSVSGCMEVMDDVDTAERVLDIIGGVPGWEFEYDADT